MKGTTLSVAISGLAIGEVFIEDFDGVSLCLDIPDKTPKKKAEVLMATRMATACKNLERDLSDSPISPVSVAHSMALDFALALMIEFAEQGWIKSPSKKRRVVVATKKDICDWVKIVWEKYVDNVRLPLAIHFSRPELQQGALVVESILQK